MMALVGVEIKQGKRADAEKNLQELQRRFPDSAATASAARMIAKTAR